MKMVSRFTWTDWAQGKVLQQSEKFWQGQHDGYAHLPDPVTHKRTVLVLDDDRWLVLDHLTGKELHHYALHWLLCDGKFGMQELAPAHGLLLDPFDSNLPDSRVLIQMGSLAGSARFSVIRADPKSTRGWRSKYYGQKEPAISTMLETDQPQAIFWTFFGFEQDKLELEGNVLNISAEHWRRDIDLTALNLSI
jgi:hypothetical protein